MTRAVKGDSCVKVAFLLGLLLAAACSAEPGHLSPPALATPRATGARVIAEREGRFGPVVVIEDREGLRRLRFGRDGVDQSAVRPGDPDHLEFAYIRHLTSALALSPHAHRVLFIGLGGGTLPMFLRRHHPEAHIDIVELDPAVVACASGFMGFVPDTRMTVHVADGRAFLEASDARWDLIVLDAYGEDNIPYTLTTRTFLTAVAGRLAPGGLIAANLWGEAVNPIYGGMLATWTAVFPEVHVLAPVGSDSRVILAFGDRRGLTRELLVEAGWALRKAWGLRFDLADAIATAWMPRERWPRRAAVLEDGQDPRERPRTTR
jgi:spermidine synthase